MVIWEAPMLPFTFNFSLVLFHSVVKMMARLDWSACGVGQAIVRARYICISNDIKLATEPLQRHTRCQYPIHRRTNN